MAKKSKIPFGDPEYRVETDDVPRRTVLRMAMCEDEPCPDEPTELPMAEEATSLGSRLEIPNPSILEVLLTPTPPVTLCDSCHTPITAYRFHFSAPQIPLCFVCYDIVNRRHTRAIQTP